MSVEPPEIPDIDPATAVGLTTTVPVEVVLAAGLCPLDLNNVFITSGRAPALVEAAERAGFPKNFCCWTKGLFATARELALQTLVAVVEGDCSNTHALAEMLRAEGVEIVPFAFPYDRSAGMLSQHIAHFAQALGTSPAAAEAQRERLAPLRRMAHELDRLTWQAGTGDPLDNHVCSISCSDFFGEPDRFADFAQRCLDAAAERNPAPADDLRLALVGIPPICDGLFAALAERGARVVFDEVPRQFSMPAGGGSLAEQYRRYTYPYDVFARLKDIATELDRRRVDGVIHYVQSFCHRQVQDVLIRRGVDRPVLTLECDRPGPLDPRSVTRVEAFLEMLRGV